VCSSAHLEARADLLLHHSPPRGTLSFPSSTGQISWSPKDLVAPTGKMDLSPTKDAARRGMLEEAMFPAFGNDAGSPDVESPEQMQKDDPLGTQIWKLYSRAKTQLPNAERMENLTWRLMSVNLKRAELERNKGYECRHVSLADRHLRSVRPLVHVLTRLFFCAALLRTARATN
jgi:hypothetical protein